MGTATIIADASFCPDTRAAGFSYWIASSNGKKRGSGAFKGRVHDSMAAETMALVNALHDAMTSGLVLKGDSILFQSDCVAALQCLETGTSAKKEIVLIISKFQHLVNKGAFVIKFKHVKGHTQNEGARFVVNRICDKFAKKHMQDARNSIRAQDLKGRMLHES